MQSTMHAPQRDKVIPSDTIRACIWSHNLNHGFEPPHPIVYHHFQNSEARKRM